MPYDTQKSWNAMMKEIDCTEYVQVSDSEQSKKVKDIFIEQNQYLFININ